MSIKNKFWSVFTFITVLFIFGCSSDENGTNTIDKNGGEVYRYQVVTVDIPDIELSQNEYAATLGNSPVTVVRADEHKLVFGIPAGAELGNTELSIPGLNNAKVKYHVLEPQLNKSADETMADLFTKSTTYFAGIETPSAEDTEALNVFEQFETYYEGLSNAEKQTVALYYQINKQAIDDVILFNGDMVSGRFSVNDVLIITRFSLAVAVTAGGGIAVLYGDVSLKVLGAVIAKIGYSKAIKYHKQLQDRSIKVVYLSASGILGQNQRNPQNTEITLISNIASTIPFKLVERPLIQADKNTANADILKFFSGQSLYNDFAVKVNSAIQWVNNNTWLTFSTIPVAVLPANPAQTQTDVTTDIMQDITFSINHPNLELVSAALQNNGQLTLKVKIIGNPAQIPIQSVLKYSYNDNLSSFEGTFPVKINAESDSDGKQLTYNITANGTVYSGSFNIPRLGTGTSPVIYYSNNGSIYIYNNYYNVTIYQNGGSTSFDFQYIPLNSNGNFQLKTANNNSVTSLTPTINGIGYLYGNGGTLTKTSDTNFTFNGIYTNQAGSEQLNVSGTVEVQ